MSNWIQDFRLNGFVVLREVFNAKEISQLSQSFDRILARAKGLTESYKKGITEFRVVEMKGKPTFKFAKWASAEDADLNEIRLHPKLMTLIQAYLGDDIKQITNQMHFKNPGDGVSFQFHQDCSFRKPDSAYRNLAASFLQSAIAIDEATIENGCLEFIPGSHRAERPILSGGYSGYEEGNFMNGEILARLPTPISALMQPGDMALWSPFTIHGSTENLSDRPRRTYINGFSAAADTDHGIWALKGGQPVPLAYGPETQWDHVEEK